MIYSTFTFLSRLSWHFTHPKLLYHIYPGYKRTVPYVSLLGVVNGFHRERLGNSPNKYLHSLINQIDEIIKGIDPHKSRNLRHKKDMEEITEYSKLRNEFLSPDALKNEQRIAEILSNITIALNDMATANTEDHEELDLLKTSIETSMRLTKQLIKKRYSLPSHKE